MGKLLEVKNLEYSFNTYAGEVQAVRGVSFGLEAGRCIGLVGESGCGKSVTAKSIAGLNPIKAQGGYKGGEILFEGRDLLKMTASQMGEMRAREIRMIFQDPMTCLNPTMTIGKQIAEGIMKSQRISKKEAMSRVVESLKAAGIPNPKDRLKQYPHEFSGGMRQRAMIALAMSVNPKLLIADEPTTALDVTIQAQILDLIKEVQKRHNTALIMITHDLGVVASMADEIAIMYAGSIMEYGKAEDIFDRPGHPYTWGVLQSIPPEDTSNREPLHPILGSPPDLFNPPKGCAFAARCPYSMKVCSACCPPSAALGGAGHHAACWLYDGRARSVTNPITKKEARR